MTNARSLALRDPAMAALMGAIDTSDFGADYGQDIGGEVGYETAMGWEDPGVHGNMGANMGDDLGWEDPGVHGNFGAPGPTPQAAIAAWHHLKHKKRHAGQREALLYPNK